MGKKFEIWLGNKKKEENSLISGEKNCSTYIKRYHGWKIYYKCKLPESVEKKTFTGGSGCIGLTAWLCWSRTVYRQKSNILSDQSPRHFLCQSVSQPASYNFKGGPKDQLFTNKYEKIAWWRNTLVRC